MFVKVTSGSLEVWVSSCPQLLQCWVVVWSDMYSARQGDGRAFGASFSARRSDMNLSREFMIFP